MHVLICTFEYGSGQGPEGICTMRLADALAAAGARVTVLTSGQGEDRPPQGGAVIRVSALPFVPRAGFALLRRVFARLLGSDFEMFWRGRLRTVALPSGVDVVYGRAMPLASIGAAKIMARRLQRPLLLHFSDPPLLMWSTLPRIAQEWRTRQYSGAVKRASAVSFTTELAMKFCESRIGMTPDKAGFVLNHVAPAPLRLPKRTVAPAPTFLYVGTFYGRRKPTLLIEAFKRVLARYPDARLRFVGKDQQYVEPDVARSGVAHAIEILPFTRDVASEYARADVLVAVDAPEDLPLFLSTKFVEYMMVDRMTLIITPRGSPSDLLAARASDTTLSVPHDVEKILEAMLVAAEAKPAASAFEARFAQMHDFEPTAIAECFLAQAEGALRR